MQEEAAVAATELGEAQIFTSLPAAVRVVSLMERYLLMYVVFAVMPQCTSTKVM